MPRISLNAPNRVMSIPEDFPSKDEFIASLKDQQVAERPDKPEQMDSNNARCEIGKVANTRWSGHAVEGGQGGKTLRRVYAGICSVRFVLAR